MCGAVFGLVRVSVTSLKMKVGVHQGSVLSPLLFIVVLEALSWEFGAGVHWDDLHADDLVIIADSLKEYVCRLLTWKEGMVRG